MLGDAATGKGYAGRAARYARSVTARIALLALMLLLAAGADAQVRPRVVDLGGGVSVRAASSIGAWVPTGFTFGNEPGLALAALFARAHSGRIVAIAPHGSPQQCAVLYSDDLGVHWLATQWPGQDVWTTGACTVSRRRAGVPATGRQSAAALALAFDPGSAHGVATTRDGLVLSTEDEGTHWRVRRTDTPGLITAWARGRTAIFLDERGQLWRSADGGFAMETLGVPVAHVEARDGELWLFQGDQAFGRVDARGTLHGM